MSEGSASRIDPRFDPRFQRGYVPDAAAMPDERESSPAAPKVPAPSTRPPHVADPPADDPAAAILDLLAQAEAQRLTPSGRVSDDSADERTAAVEPDAAPSVLAAPGDEPEPVVEVSPTRWLWIALAACLVFILVGVAIFWNGASDRSMFMGAPSGLEGAFNQFSMALAPGLVQAGVLGAIAILVTWAITGRRSRRDAE